MKFFFKMKLSLKLAIGFAFVLILTLLISAIAINSLNSSIKTADIVHELVGENYSLLDNCQTLNNNISSSISNYLNENNQTLANKTKVDENIAKSQELYLKLVKDTRNTNYQSDVDVTMSHYQNVISRYKDTIIPLVNSGHVERALAYYIDTIQPEVREVRLALTNLNKKLMKHITSEVDVLRDPTSLMTVIVFLIVALVLGASASFILGIYITKRISNLCNVADAIANNDLTVDVKHISEDEFGHLEQSMTKMRDNLSTTVMQVMRVSEQLSSEIASTSNAATEVLDAAKSAENQSVSVAAAADQMVSTTADIAKNCESAASESADSRDIAMSGMDAVRLAVDQIREQSHRTNEDAEKIQALADQSQKIGSIVGTIDEIAAQTNLLALNAAIEAARAGEAGRGFAVVADEVRALASRTTKSTHEISSMVSQIQTDANIATQSMEESVNNMNSVAEKAGTLEDTLTAVLDKVNSVNSQITQIATAAEEQTSATSEISANMQGITESTQVVFSMSQSSIDVTQRSVQAIVDLQTSLKLFKVSE